MDSFYNNCSGLGVVRSPVPHKQGWEAHLACLGLKSWVFRYHLGCSMKILINVCLQHHALFGFRYATVN